MRLQFKKRQSVLFHYAFVGLFFELVDAQFYASVEVLNDLRIEQTSANIIRVKGQRVIEILLLRRKIFFIECEISLKRYQVEINFGGFVM